MTAFVFPMFKAQLLSGEIQFPAMTVRAALVTAAPDQGIRMVSEIAASIAAISTPLAAPSFPTPGAFTSWPATFLSVASQVPITGFVLFADTGDKATSPLVAYQDDTQTGRGFPYTATGGPVTITPDATSGWFTL